MRIGHLGFAALLLVGACDNSVDRDLEGKACDEAHLCVAGYVCRLSTNTCVRLGTPRSTTARGGAAGAAGSGGTGPSSSFADAAAPPPSDGGMPSQVTEVPVATGPSCNDGHLLCGTACVDPKTD